MRSWSYGCGTGKIGMAYETKKARRERLRRALILFTDESGNGGGQPPRSYRKSRALRNPVTP